MNKKLSGLLQKRVLLLDGATGTQLNLRGMPSGVCPESWCLQNPHVLASVHRDYITAGSDIIYTCTFGANRLKLSQYGICDVRGTNEKLALLARSSSAGKNCFVAGDIGPTGKFVRPFGSLDFEEAVNIFKEQIKGLLAGGVDMLVIETMMDIQEARAALIAARELTKCFTIVTMTFEKGGRTLNGNTPLSVLVTLQSLGADAIGCNCSTGPDDMLKIIKAMKPYASVPLVAKPNAGIPKLVGDKTVFTMDAERFSLSAMRLIRSGANIIGGCCGTAPEYISRLKNNISRIKPIWPLRKNLSAISSARSVAVISRNKTVTVVGEKINPTGKKDLQKELLAGSFTLLRQIAKEQQSMGAQALDVNVGVAGINEKRVLSDAICVLSLACDLPLVLDSSKPDSIEAALRLYPGRALINSISAESADKLLPLAKKYGAMCILLPIAGKDIPATFDKRKKIIQAILRRIEKSGMSREDIIIDCLALAVSCEPAAALVALATIAYCSRVLKCKTIIGLSNISFGLPARRLINKTFFTLAKRKGLSVVIASPLEAVNFNNKSAEKLLFNQDKGAKKFIVSQSHRYKKKIQVKAVTLPIGKRIYQAVIDADKEAISELINEAITSGIPAFKVTQDYLIPAIIKVGEFFEKKEYFLPQLIASAQTMQQAIKRLEPHLSEQKRRQAKGVILLATVEGDVHDIGKNIVALLLKNHGFTIIDLGKDVSAQSIICAIKKYSPDIVGLSALMTTTLVNMDEVIALAKKEGLRCKFMAGGAVVNEPYASSIGATYAKDAVAAVKVANKLISTSKTA
ncbi:MAG: homocysteine S-methyltransferase family protein [Candidatus Omnitrophica bacterium]|nr:homocysteine S-methyltransferase family protein [Candidatus Omnitrophota bacterium]